MQGQQNRNSIGHLSVLMVLWLINLLIVIFATPFLIYKKIRAIFLKSAKNSGQKKNIKQKSDSYLPCRIDSKL